MRYLASLALGDLGRDFLVVGAHRPVLLPPLVGLRARELSAAFHCGVLPAASVMRSTADLYFVERFSSAIGAPFSCASRTITLCATSTSSWQRWVSGRAAI